MCFIDQETRDNSDICIYSLRFSAQNMTSDFIFHDRSFISQDMKVMFPGPPLTPNFTYPYMTSKPFYAVYNSEEAEIQGDHCPSAYICESCSYDTFECPAVCEACSCDDICPMEKMMMGWGMWSMWSECSAECEGVSTRTRYCMGGEECADMWGSGNNYENMACGGACDSGSDDD